MAVFIIEQAADWMASFRKGDWMASFRKEDWMASFMKEVAAG